MVKQNTAAQQKGDYTSKRLTAVQHYENQAYSIGFAVNDNLSISYTEETSKVQKKKAALSNTNY